MAKGGARAGAGRPKGAPNRPHILDYWEDGDVDAFFASLKKRYKKSDRITGLILEQISGKAPQAIDLTSGGKPLLITDE